MSPQQPSDAEIAAFFEEIDQKSSEVAQNGPEEGGEIRRVVGGITPERRSRAKLQLVEILRSIEQKVLSGEVRCLMYITLGDENAGMGTVGILNDGDDLEHGFSLARMLTKNLYDMFPESDSADE